MFHSELLLVRGTVEARGPPDGQDQVASGEAEQGYLFLSGTFSTTRATAAQWRAQTSSSRTAVGKWHTSSPSTRTRRPGPAIPDMLLAA
ncbi:hypothetical protein GCM10022295_82380 [Streptomyces osmaniensis]|uniref:YCII-related domain-containing protein n=1 Tax=Streptomyces osmaniensis TaxID=593134 RepID=A0ABP6YRN4_9ACTN